MCMYVNPNRLMLVVHEPLFERHKLQFCTFWRKLNWCVWSPDEPLLLASVQSELLLLGVHSGSLSLLSPVSRPVFSLDYHWVQQRLYWLSPDYQSIRWADMKNSNSKGSLIKGTVVHRFNSHLTFSFLLTVNHIATFRPLLLCIFIKTVENKRITNHLLGLISCFLNWKSQKLRYIHTLLCWI